jgi:asparagine synthase (glutamine-hydrolysing)
MTRQHVTVALTGDGGDENFAGYTRYSQMLRWSRLGAIMPAGARRAIRGCVRRVIGSHGYSNVGARVHRGFDMLLSPLPERYGLAMSILKPQEKSALYSPQFQARADGAHVLRVALPWHGTDDPVDWMMRQDQNAYLPDCLMVKADIASMAHGLELRAPFLDHRMVEFASCIPSTLKLRDGSGKHVLRNAIKGLLPDPVLQKPKTGFGVPLAKWLRRELAPLLQEVLLDERCRKRGLFQPVFPRRMVDEHLSGSRDWSNRLWALLFLESWFREFID